jgi:hypothetical protein
MKTCSFSLFNYYIKLKVMTQASTTSTCYVIEICTYVHIFRLRDNWRPDSDPVVNIGTGFLITCCYPNSSLCLPFAQVVDLQSALLYVYKQYIYVSYTTSNDLRSLLLFSKISV